MAAEMEKLVARLEAVTTRLEAAGAGRGAAAATDDDPEWFDEYKADLAKDLTKFVADSKAIGGDMEPMGDLLDAAFTAHANMLTIAARNNRPKEADLQALLKHMSSGIISVQDFREAQRRSKEFNFLSALSEGIPFLGWVVISPKPAAYVGQMEESAQFYTNKVLKEFKESEPAKADWARNWIKLLKKFNTYVKDRHGSGLVWNKDKPAATATTTAGASAPAPPAGAPPPPPPPGPPPPPPPAGAAPAAGGGEEGRGALFAALNKGDGVTSGLKKVSKDQMTHKNPELRNKPPVAAKSANLAPRPFGASPQLKKFGAAAAPVKKPPVFELQNKKWVVEWQEGNQQLVIDDAEPNHTVYMYKCNNSVLQVKTKVNSITLDQCKKCAIVFENLISTCEFINCQSMKAQANGAVPTISVDKTDGMQIFLNDKNMDTQIITAKSSEMNVCVTNDDGDLKETPLPEQYITKWDGKKWLTTTMDLNL